MFLYPARPGDARVAELTRAFLIAEYRWQHEGSWRELVIGERARSLEEACPQASSFGLLSAWNPLSMERGRTVNQQQDDVLRSMLLDGGHVHFPAFSSARNRTWREPGWLVLDMDAGSFHALSRRFGQLGTLWWTAGDPVLLQMDATRPATIDDGNIAWLR